MRTGEINLRCKSLPLLALAISLVACGQQKKQPAQLDANQRAGIVLELVEKRNECDAIRQKLKTPNLSSDEIDSIYREALQTKCINKDA